MYERSNSLAQEKVAQEKKNTEVQTNFRRKNFSFADAVKSKKIERKEDNRLEVESLNLSKPEEKRVSINLEVSKEITYSMRCKLVGEVECFNYLERIRNLIAEEDDNGLNSEEDENFNFDEDGDKSSSEEDESENFSDEEDEGSIFKTETVIQETIIRDGGKAAAHGVENWKSQASVQETEKVEQNNQKDLNEEGEKNPALTDQITDDPTTSSTPNSPQSKMENWMDTDPNKNLMDLVKTGEVNNILDECSDTLRILL
ncbi:hypothetical protein L2E82_31284 [Cichorium intybus]|uniref:Uncharacterized protein n=1 Tax=Cichorium intybus TaxID=13427 RepID=A0ACB9D2Z6_CICIN|nr:hypothetical protein L2E82_31284 [Cichorium intybus]